LESILDASPDRVTPPCPVFEKCGGCHLQHGSYEAQLRIKEAMLRESLARIGGIEWAGPVKVIAGEPLGYRNRTQFHLDAKGVGFHAAGSNSLVTIEQCPISSPRINEALAILRRMQRDRRFPKFVRSVELFTNEREIQLNVLNTERGIAKTFFEWCREEGLTGANASSLIYPAGGYKFRVSHQSFFQVNRFMLDALVDAALDGATGFTAIDLYAGVGLFTLPLAKRFTRRVVGVEVVKSAASDLSVNLQRADLEAVVIQKSTEEFLATQDTRPDFILADPPRAGLGKRAVADLVRVKAGELSIVSCDPATLARDLKGLIEGGYEITSIALADLFPQTYHLEGLVRLRLR
jgi:23S rRNA (uracil1939-C5)-methyltransferase